MLGVAQSYTTRRRPSSTLHSTSTRPLHPQTLEVPLMGESGAQGRGV